MSLFHNATYVASAHRLQDLPPPADPEVAFAGRSNAGKSSAINALANRTRLAFVSKTPGRTQQINFFRLDGGLLVDLPGYGYAKVPDDLRRHWETTLGTYLQTRPSLRGLVLVMDARHPFTDRDEGMVEWFRPTGRPVHVLLTKSDKLSRSEQALTLKNVERRLAALGSNYSAQLFSSLRRIGVDEARATVARWLDLDPQPLPATRPPARRLPAGGRNKKAPSQRGKLGAKRLKFD